MSCKILLCGAVIACCAGAAFAAPFVVFPKAAELASPDGHYVVRNAEREASTTDFVGIFHSLWLVELPSGRSRKLCDYSGVAAVGWSGNQFLLVTEYARRTSRAFVFSIANPDEVVMLDSSTLTRLVATEFRSSLRENDHVFVEASRLEEEKLYLRVWGYGQHDADGFRWRCEYTLRQGSVSCTDERTSH